MKPQFVMKISIRLLLTKIGSQNVTAKNFNKDKLHITVILCFLSEGTKIPPLIIFRGETNKNKEKKLQIMNMLKKDYVI